MSKLKDIMINGKSLADLLNKSSRLILDSSSIEEVELDSLIFSKAMILSMTFRHVVFRECTFNDCVLNDTTFYQCSFINCKFYSNVLQFTNFRECKFYSSRGLPPYNYSCAGFNNIVEGSFEECLFDFDKVMYNKFESCLFNKCNEQYPSKSKGKLIFRANCFYCSTFIDLDMCAFKNLEGDNAFDICRFKNIENMPRIPIICPEEGSFVGYKKVKKSKMRDELIAVLLIPKDAKRTSSYQSRKCRCSKAKVIRFETLTGEVYPNDILCMSAFVNKQEPVQYVKGKIVKADDFDPDRTIECSHGIHFFMTREEAVLY